MNMEVRPLSADLQDDFFHLHGDAHGGGWCYCVAWWVPTWEGWIERTAAQNREFRERLFAEGNHDGFLLYTDGAPVGWCQVGPRDRLEKLVRQFDRPPDPDAWAITCFFVASDHRRRGVASELLKQVLAQLKAKGVKRVEAYPNTSGTDEEGEHWTGPPSLYEGAGFHELEGGPKRSVMVLEL
ncbi:MAG: GNAT family N-acetyltransferase [Planctomycetota bacterium]|jgi:GNAT superfamily N-acetyltransferase